MKKVLLYISIVVFLSSCIARKELNTVTFDKMEMDDAFLVSIQTGACFGTCPEYKMEVDHKGVVKYQGNRNVPLLGEAQSVLDETDLMQLKKQLLNLEIHNLDSAYTCNVADLPEVAVLFKVKKQRKMVYVVCDAPEKLTDFISFLDKIRVAYMPAEIKMNLTEEEQ